MQRELQRRLQAAETRRYGSPRVAAFLRAIDAMSDAELAGEIEMAESDPDFMRRRLQPLSDTELDLVIREFDDRAARVRRAPSS